jgi:hypothetical protein
MTKKTVVCAFLVSLGLSILGAPAVVAAQYLGETTWTMTKTQDKNGPVIPPKAFTCTGAITRMGGVYYTMQGYGGNASAGGNPIFTGGGVLIGNLLYLTLSYSQLQTSTVRETGVIHLELDKTTLNGTFSDVAHNFDISTEGPNPVFSDFFAAGTLTRTGPFINLTPGALVGSTSLLFLE